MARCMVAGPIYRAAGVDHQGGAAGGVESSVSIWLALVVRLPLVQASPAGATLTPPCSG